MSGQSAKSLSSLLLFACLFAGMLAAQSEQGNAQPNPTVDSKPKALYAPQPQYPDSARHDKIQGTVKLSTTVDTDGLPSNTRVVKSLRSDFDQRAIETVNTWKFRPAMKDGKPVPYTISIEAIFRLAQN